MTNANVEQTVAAVDGRTLTVKYKDGEKKIIVPPDPNPPGRGAQQTVFGFQALALAQGVRQFDLCADDRQQARIFPRRGARRAA